MPFKTLGLSDPLVRGILATGYTAPTEIQSQVIPAAIEGKDIIGCAQTGTGKTAAFVLPILNRLSHEHATKNKHIKAMILTPTRELAVQIGDSLYSLHQVFYIIAEKNNSSYIQPFFYQVSFLAVSARAKGRDGPDEFTFLKQV